MNQTKHTELLKEQLNVEESQNNSNSSKKEITFEQKYKDSGLVVRGDATNGYFVTAGQFIVSPTYKLLDEAFDRLDNHDYQILMGIIDAMILFSKMNDSPEK